MEREKSVKNVKKDEKNLKKGDKLQSTGIEMEQSPEIGRDHKKNYFQARLTVLSSDPVEMASPLGWNLTLFMSD